MSIITISTPFNIDLEFKLAAFGKRLMAWFIDLMVITAYYYLSAKIVDKIDGELFSNVLIGIFVFVLPVISYQLVFEIFFNGQTIGKRLSGIKIIDANGQEPSWSQYIIRYVLAFGNYFIFALPYMILNYPFYIFTFFIVYIPDVITVLVSTKSQRIGDLAAGTVVIDATYQPDITDTIYKEIEVTNYVPQYPQVMRLTDRDINGIRNLLKIKRGGKDNELYMQQVVYKIKTVLDLQSDLEDRDFLEQLLYDYNYLTTKGN